MLKHKQGESLPDLRPIQTEKRFLSISDKQTALPDIATLRTQSFNKAVE